MNLTDKGNILLMTGALHALMETVKDSPVKVEVLKITGKIKTILVKEAGIKKMIKK